MTAICFLHHTVPNYTIPFMHSDKSSDALIVSNKFGGGGGGGGGGVGKVWEIVHGTTAVR